MSADRERPSNRSTPPEPDEAGKAEAASLKPDDAGKGPITVVKAGKGDVGSDDRSAAGAVSR